MFKPVFHRTATYLTGIIVLLLIVGTVPVRSASEEIQWRESVEGHPEGSRGNRQTYYDGLLYRLVRVV